MNNIILGILLTPLITLSGSTAVMTILVLLSLVFIDFITGILASYVEFKKNPTVLKAYLIESHRLRDSVIKVVFYLIFIMIVHASFTILAIPFIKVFVLELVPFSVASVITILIEAFSIIENIKRAGFDVVKQLKIVVTKIMSVLKYVKDIKKELE